MEGTPAPAASALDDQQWAPGAGPDAEDSGPGTGELRLSDILGEDDDLLGSGSPPARPAARASAYDELESLGEDTGPLEPVAAPEPRTQPISLVDARESADDGEYPEEELVTRSGGGGLGRVLAYVLPILAGGALGLVLANLIW